MRLPVIIAACLAATAAVAQVPRIKWKPMDFPPTTTMEATVQGEQRDLGAFRIFYDFAKMQNWSCAFDNAGGPRSGPSTLSCRAPNKPAWDFYVEHYPDEKRLVFVEGNFAGNPRTGEEVGGMLAIFFKNMR